MPTWSRSLLAATAAAGLVLGLLVGAFVGGRTELVGGGEGPDDTSSGTPVTAGAIHEFHEENGEGWDFELPVFNSTDASIDVSLVGAENLSSPLRSDTAENISPGTWGRVRFSMIPNCDAREPVRIMSVRLRVRTSGDQSSLTLPLPGDGDRGLGDYHRTMCASGEGVDPSEIAGGWALETVYGADPSAVGQLLLWFGRDGSFIADHEQDLFSADVGVRGRYRLDGELLTINVQGGYGCRRGTQAVWRVNIDTNDVMSMVWLRGECRDWEEGVAWRVRRILDSDVTQPG